MGLVLRVTENKVENKHRKLNLLRRGVASERIYEDLLERLNPLLVRVLQATRDRVLAQDGV
jgi:hypothetical protein